MSRDSLSKGQKVMAFLCLALAPVLLSTNMIFGKAAIDEIGPGSLAFLRWLITGLILTAVFYTQVRPKWPVIKANLPQFLMLAFLAMGVCGTGVYAALMFTSATNSGLIYGVSPILILLLGAYVLGERITGRQWAGVAVALSGAITIITKGDPALVLGLAFNVGDLLMVAAILAWAFYSVYVKRGAMRELSTFGGLAVLALCGAVVNFPFYLAEAVNFGFFPTSRIVWLELAGLVFLSSLGAFGTYNTAVALVGPGRTGPIMYFLPVHTVLMSVFFLGETFRPYHGVGLALVLTGVILASARLPGRGRRGPKGSETPQNMETPV